jgi:purine-binding chemotaxis protein CheW
MASAVSFLIDGQRYAVSVERVVEILAAVALAPIPDAPPFVLGMMNCRGKLVPVIDLAARIRARPAPHLRATGHILVVRLSDGPLGCLVDRVVDVRDVGPEAWLRTDQIAPTDVPLPLGLLDGALKRADGAEAVIDLGRVLTADERVLLRQIEEGAK